MKKLIRDMIDGKVPVPMKTYKHSFTLKELRTPVQGRKKKDVTHKDIEKPKDSELETIKKFLEKL